MGTGEETGRHYIVQLCCKLIADGSEVLDAMDGLYCSGADILACGTCVDFYNLKNSIKTGRVSNMEEICSLLMQAEKVITI